MLSLAPVFVVRDGLSPLDSVVAAISIRPSQLLTLTAIALWNSTLRGVAATVITIAGAFTVAMHAALPPWAITALLVLETLTYLVISDMFLLARLAAYASVAVRELTLSQSIQVPPDLRNRGALTALQPPPILRTLSVEHTALPSIVVLDFGSQYTQLIARRIREQNVFSVVLPCTAKLQEIRSYNPVGIILSGGPCSVYDVDAPPADPEVLNLGLPVLGICYGLQFMTHTLGGTVHAASKREYGHAEVSVLESSALFSGLPETLSVWMSHGDEADKLAPGFRLVARTSNAVAAIENVAAGYYAVQFHPEVHHTKFGTDLLKNFVFGICQAQPSWTPQKFIDSDDSADS